MARNRCPRAPCVSMHRSGARAHPPGCRRHALATATAAAAAAASPSPPLVPCLQPPTSWPIALASMAELLKKLFNPAKPKEQHKGAGAQGRSRVWCQGAARCPCAARLACRPAAHRALPTPDPADKLADKKKNEREVKEALKEVKVRQGWPPPAPTLPAARTHLWPDPPRLTSLAAHRRPRPQKEQLTKKEKEREAKKELLKEERMLHDTKRAHADQRHEKKCVGGAAQGGGGASGTQCAVPARLARTAAPPPLCPVGRRSTRRLGRCASMAWCVWVCGWLGAYKGAAAAALEPCCWWCGARPLLHAVPPPPPPHPSTPPPAVALQGVVWWGWCVCVCLRVWGCCVHVSLPVPCPHPAPPLTCSLSASPDLLPPRTQVRRPPAASNTMHTAVPTT